MPSIHQIESMISARSTCIFILLLCFTNIVARGQIKYALTYDDSTKALLHITIQSAKTLGNPVQLVVPRSIPGHYSISEYDKSITNVYAFSGSGQKFQMERDFNDAPRWIFSNGGIKIERIEYDVDLEKMERTLSKGESSILRRGFAGLLNYSTFGWIEGLEQLPVECSVNTFPAWPIFSTNQPSTSLSQGKLTFSAANYFALADGQIFLGPQFVVREFKGLVPLFVASYCQSGKEYLDDYGEQGTASLGILQQYFGELPFKHYSIMLLKAMLKDVPPGPSLAMEHLQSSTFFGDTTGIRRGPISKERVLSSMPTYLHHMAHAYIPMRCYGDNYRPYVLEIPPVIRNIWFNEGFLWYLVYDTLKVPRMMTNFTNSTYETSDIIKKMDLEELSETASMMYGIDFRIGRAIYSRGALMALEMNEYLLKSSNGKKSIRDVLRYLYKWSKQNNRPFTMDEFPGLVNRSCGIDVGHIYNKWQLAISKN